MKNLTRLIFTLFMAVAILPACSSTEESSSSSGTDTTKCAEQCALAPDHQRDECIMTCEAAN